MSFRPLGAHSNSAVPLHRPTPPTLPVSVSVTFMKQTHLTLLRAFQFVAAAADAIAIVSAAVVVAALKP